MMMSVDCCILVDDCEVVHWYLWLLTCHLLHCVVEILRTLVFLTLPLFEKGFFFACNDKNLYLSLRCHVEAK